MMIDYKRQCVVKELPLTSVGLTIACSWSLVYWQFKCIQDYIHALILTALHYPHAGKYTGVSLSAGVWNEDHFFSTPIKSNSSSTHHSILIQVLSRQVILLYSSNFADRS